MSAAVREAVDCDVHCAPASLEALAPYLDDSWVGYIEDAGIALNGRAGGAYPPHVPAAPATYEELERGLLGPSEPRHVLLNCVTLNEIHRNPYFSAAVARAINDWLRSEWLDRDERLRASMCVSTLDMDAAVAEVERLGADPRFVQVLLPVRSDTPYGNVRYHPLYEAAVRHDLAIGLHAWGRAGSAPGLSGFTATYIEDYLANSQIVQTQLVSLVSEGVFDRFPELRVALIECGFTWLPSLLWRFDKDWKGVWREVPWVRSRPSEYVRRHFRATTEPAQLPRTRGDRAALLEMVGVDMLMFASDHPHDHGASGAAMLEALDADAREAITRTTASGFYRCMQRE
jgi:predicted TIM-barrel fold metal-dependent hydrolase